MIGRPAIDAAPRRFAKIAIALLRAVTAGLGATIPGSAGQGDSAILNLGAYERTFNDSFTAFDISADGAGTTWSAHTPWHGDFGDAVFEDPGPRSPFSIEPHGGLRITATRDVGGRWHSGLISSRDRDGPAANGFSQQYGYFEMRARLPAGEGTWPAFWLIGTQKSEGASEIDVVEFYGGFPGYFHSVLHYFHGGQDLLRDDHIAAIPPGQISTRFNDFGVSIEEDETTFYFNRREIWRRPTPAAFRQPFYLLANLAIGGGWRHDRLSSPASMVIERITVFARRPNQSSEHASDLTSGRITHPP